MDSDKDKTNQEISKTPKEIDQQNTKEILDETQTSNADLFKFLNTYNSSEIDNLKKRIQYLNENLNETNRIANEKILELAKQLEPARQGWLELAKKIEPVKQNLSEIIKQIEPIKLNLRNGLEDLQINKISQFKEADIHTEMPDTDILKLKLKSSEKIIQDLEEKLNQAQSKTVKNNEEITKLLTQLERKNIEKEKIEEELNSKIEELTEGLSNRIKDAQKSLSGALKNTDSQIQNNENTARWFKWLGIILFGLAIILLLVFSGFVLCNSNFFSDKKLNILFYTFPIITLMVIGTTCLRHQKNLLAEVRHFSNMKHQIELYSGLLEASQHAAVSFNNPEKANEYVQETFTQIRNRLLNSQYLPDHSSSDNQSDNDFVSDKVIDLLSKIADLSGKKPI
ncbi:TPA: hypothetical protein ACQWGN_000993 [Neisseria subflava]|jgi:hypothetical protein